MEEERVCYIYRHIRNDNGQPFYIGKGTKPRKIYPSTEYERAYDKYSRSKEWREIADSVGYTVEIMLDFISPDDIDTKEREFISLYGRIIAGGSLVNLTDGGSGKTNYIPKESTKQKLREINAITIEEHIKENVYPEPNTGCFLWAGKLDKRFDSAVVHIEGRSGLSAHKYIFESTTGIKVPKGKMLIRSCKNKICVNPDHCYIGDYKDRDHKGKARQYKHHRQVLTEPMVKEMRVLNSQGLGPSAIARKYNVSIASVGFMLNGKSWSWLK